MLPNICKTDHPHISQGMLAEIYKPRITEFIYTPDKEGKNILDRYLLRETLDTTDKYITDLINYIWASYCYMMGRTNYHFAHCPPPPMYAQEWLIQHLKPSLEEWRESALISSALHLNKS